MDVSFLLFLSSHLPVIIGKNSLPVMQSILSFDEEKIFVGYPLLPFEGNLQHKAGAPGFFNREGYSPYLRCIVFRSSGDFIIEHLLTAGGAQRTAHPAFLCRPIVGHKEAAAEGFTRTIGQGFVSHTGIQGTIGVGQKEIGQFLVLVIVQKVLVLMIYLKRKLKI